MFTGALICYRVGVFFFLTMNMAFANMNALELFINERAMFMWVEIFNIFPNSRANTGRWPNVV